MAENKLELLAPAGSFGSLQAAVHAGADAVYMGGSRFGARAYAENPEGQRLLEAIDYAHLYGAKFYLTVNTLLKERELEEELYDYLLPLYEQGVDALIVQDLGVLRAVREWFPDLKIHASTQMSLTGAGSAKLLEEAGAARIIPARELSLAEIARIHRETDLEIECFVHGALCYCYSGQCLFSSILGGRSGNRGRCAQPCRLPYDAVCDGKVLSKKGENALLSPKDLCAVELLPKLGEAGVTSLKIEGRMKKPAYVAGVVRIYRKYVDMYLQGGTINYQVDERDKRELELLFNRDGFSEGYFERHNGRSMMALWNRPETDEEKREHFRLAEGLRSEYVDKQKKLPISGVFYGKAGEPMTLTVRLDGREVTVRGECPQIPQTSAMGRDEIEKQLRKTGGTPFTWADLDIRLDGDLFIPNQMLNRLRREALEKIVRLSPRHPRPASRPLRHPEAPPEGSGRTLHISVETEGQLEAVLSQASKLRENEIAPLGAVYLEAECLEEHLPELLGRLHGEGLKGFVALPMVFRDLTRDRYRGNLMFWRTLDADGFVVRNPEGYMFLRENHLAGRGKMAVCRVVLDHSVYTWNNRCRELWREEGVQWLTNPLELNRRELSEISGADSIEIIYGRYPLMITAGCLKKTLNQCRRQPGLWALRDRYKKEFPVQNDCRDCYNVIYNSQPLVLFDRTEELEGLHAGAWRLMFTTEGRRETEGILKAWLSGSRPAGEFTRGHWKRGVE